MSILDTIDDILAEEDSILPKRVQKEETKFSFDDEIFSRMANFIINLEPDDLSDGQVEDVIDMISDLEVDDDEIESQGEDKGEGEIKEVRKPKLARRTLATKNQASKKWYRKNRTKIRRRKSRFKRSSEGRKRLKAKERLARQGRTPTGRKKVRYHRRVRSDRTDRENKNERNR